MPNKRIKKKSDRVLRVGEPQAAYSYEQAVEEADEPRMQKVSVTVDRGLLTFVDHFVEAHPGLSRSEVFDRALEMWAKYMQRQSDIACYSDESTSAAKRQEASDWSSIQAEAAKDIW